MELNLVNKTFLVTGSSKGIGKSIAQSFLEEGANVILVSRGKETLDQTYQELLRYVNKNKLIRFKADCTNENEVINLRNYVFNNFNNLDGLIANVGNGSSTNDPISDKNKWSETWDINFNSALITSRIFLNDLISSKGCILYISSIAGTESIGAPTDYSVAKSAIISLSKNLSRKIAPAVRVNTICPGNIIFDGGTWSKKIKQNKEQTAKIINDFVPMKRFGIPEEIASAALFLCSSKASFITGSVLIVDGGQTQTIL